VRILVTGGAGFVGSHVVDRLLADGHAVSVVDNLSTGRREVVAAAAALHVCDVRSPRLEAVVAEARPDAVVHVAAQAAVPRSVADPLFDASVNVLGTLALLAACRRSGVARIVYTSTGGAAYGDTDVLPTPEDHPTSAASPYGVSKVAAERYLECWSGLTRVPTLALRLANVYGPRQNPLGEAGVIAIFIHRLLRGEVCVINGGGEQTRDYVFVADVADAVARALERPEARGVVNVGTGLETSVNALYDRLARAAGAGRRAPVHAPARPGEQRRSVLDPTRAKLLLGWTPATPLEQGIERTVAAFRAELVGRGAQPPSEVSGRNR
jgi:UDP-glucose 4-epimerase